MHSTITNYQPEDSAFWEKEGKNIANRNLWISIFNLIMGFIVWYIFSGIVLHLNDVGYHLTSGQIINLVSLPALFGATLRIFYGFLILPMGGRTFTVLSSLTLFIPVIGIGLASQNPSTPYWVLVILALASGFGCGNFSSSNANIPPFFPKKLQGTALGLNAGIGNLGVSIVQFSVPFLISTAIFTSFLGQGTVVSSGKTLYLQNAAYIWLIPLALAVVLAFFKMDNLKLTSTPKFKEQLYLFKRKDTYLIMILYMMTFGSFAGLASVFALLLHFQFPSFDPLKIVFLGALVGAALRPVGGMLSDKFGSSNITILTFVTIGILVYLLTIINSLVPFIIVFVILFAATGVGNGSVFALIANVFGAKEKSGALGFISAIGAYGAFFIPQIFKYSMSMSNTITNGFYTMFVINIVCLGITYYFYYRKNIGRLNK